MKYLQVNINNCYYFNDTALPWKSSTGNYNLNDLCEKFYKGWNIRNRRDFKFTSMTAIVNEYLELYS
jgi:hypothetical protein